MITESACRQWGARGFRKMLRIKGLGARGEEAAGKPSRGTNQAEEPEEKAKGRTRRWGRLDLGWRVSQCRSSDYEKRVPSMGSTRVQDIAEDQGVRRQKKSGPEGARARHREIGRKGCVADEIR